MKTLKLNQGDAAWHAHRATARNASDAPALMGASPYVSRAELVKRRATGITPDVDAATQRVFDRGHAVEPLLRAIVEDIIGEELYPVVATSDDGYLSASFDGINMDGTIIFEAKQFNADKARSVGNGALPDADYWQCVQQLAVCETAEKLIYIVGDGTAENSHSLEVLRKDIEDSIVSLRAAWSQFDADVAAYQPQAEAPKPVAAPVEGFGALSLRVEGRVLASNLGDFEASARAFIARLPKPAELQSDQDFADAEAAVKACADAESRIKSAKDAALAQMADVDTVLRSADTIAEAIRAARLALDKAVKAEKENRKADAVREGLEAIRAHCASINATLQGHEIALNTSVTTEIGAAIKGLRTLASIRDKIADAVAQAKIAASAEADKLRQCIAVLREHDAHAHLFHDRAALVAAMKPDDLRNLIAVRIAKAEADERARAEAAAEAARAKIRAEEEAKARAEAEAKMEAERQRIREEERQRAAAAPVVAHPATPTPVVAQKKAVRERQDPFSAWRRSTGRTFDDPELRSAWDAGFAYGIGQRAAA